MNRLLQICAYVTSACVAITALLWWALLALAIAGRQP